MYKIYMIYVSRLEIDINIYIYIYLAFPDECGGAKTAF